MNIFLVTTFILDESRRKLLERMIHSVTGAAFNRQDVRLSLYAFVPKCSPSSLEAFKSTLPPFASAFAIEGKASLSEARNQLLTRLFSTEMVHNDDIIAYPDDDCWYPDGFLGFAAKAFLDDEKLDFWFCRYASAPQPACEAPAARPARVRDVVRNASSTTIFLRGRVAKTIGSFDESLGLGARYAGEDLDYALRACEAARRSVFCDAALIGHRDKRPEFRAIQYQGKMFVLRRYAGNSLAHFIQCARKFAIGVLLCARGQLSVTLFLQSSFGALPPKTRDLALWAADP